MKKSLVIDSRMINNSGIGTYLKNVIPNLKSTFDLILLGNKEELEILKFSEFARIIEFNCPIFSIKEQLLLPQKIPSCDFFWTPHYNFPILPIKAKKKIVTLHDAYYFAFFDSLTITQRAYLKVVSLSIARRANLILTVSDFSKSEINKYLNLPDNLPIKVVYNGVDPNFGNKTSLSKIDYDYILYVGNVKPHKNLKNALEAFKMYKKNTSNEKLKFLIVGQKEGFITGDYSLSNLIVELQENVIFTGYVSLDELKSYYSNAKVFFFPSKYEGFGIPILEAMTFDLPILASNIPPVVEIAKDTIQYCDPSNIDEIANCLANIINDTKEKKFRQDVYAPIIKYFNWNFVADNHIKAILSI